MVLGKLTHIYIHFIHRGGVCNCAHLDALEGDMN
jgi:hypothetical protein